MTIKTNELEVMIQKDGRMAIRPKKGPPLHLSRIRYPMPASTDSVILNDDDVRRIIDLYVVPRGEYQYRLAWYRHLEVMRWLRLMHRRKLLRFTIQAPYFWSSRASFQFYQDASDKEAFQLNVRGTIIAQTIINHERSLHDVDPSHLQHVREAHLLEDSGDA